MRLAALSAVLVLVLAGCGDDTQPEEQTADPLRTEASGWDQLPDAPLAGRTSATVVGVEDRVYVLGGWSFLCPPMADCAGPSEPPFADGAVLDLSTNEWEPIADAPAGFLGGSHAVLGHDIYLAVSCTDDQDCYDRPYLWRYDIVEDAWTDLGRIPKDVGGQLVATDHGLVAVSGSYETGDRDEARFDVESATWEPLPDSPLPRSYDRFGVADGDRLLLFGSPKPEDNEESGPKASAAYDFATGTWTELPSAPGHGFQVWRAGERAFLNPHYGDGGGVFDLGADTWSPFPDGPDDPAWENDLAGLIAEDGATYEYSAGWVFDARKDSWVEIPRRGSEAYDESSAAVGQSLVVFGGQVWEDDDGELTSETWIWRPPAN